MCNVFVLLFVNLCKFLYGYCIYEFCLSDAPSKPEPPNIDKITKESVTLSWAKPDDGGSKILGYYIEKRMKGAKEWDIINNILHKERTFTVSKLH